MLRKAAIAGLVALPLMALFLISPRVPREQETALCVTVIDVAGPVHLTINCDSAEFVELAHRPGLLFTLQHRVWQSRPLYPAAGWVAAWPFRVVPPALIAPVLARGGNGRFGPYLPEFAGLLFVNLLLLVASIVLFQGLLSAPSLFSPWTLLPLTVLVVNEVTKAFFWTPHLQLANLFVPVVSLYLLCWLQPRLKTLRLQQFAWIGLGLGLGGLFYGAFAVTVLGASLCILAGDARLSAKAARLALLLGGFIAPIVAWVGSVVFFTGSFYSHEVAKFRQFVWMGDSLTHGLIPFVTDLARNLSTYSGVLTVVAIFPCLLLTAALSIRLALGISSEVVEDRTRGFATAIYLVSAVPFYALMGYYATRLAWSLVPAILLLLGLELRRLEAAVAGRTRHALEVSLVSVAVLYVLYWVMRPGPYS